MKKLASAMVGMAMLGLAAGAYAQTGDQGQQQEGGAGTQDPSGKAGAAVGSPQAMAGQQVEGRVLKADSKNITIEYMGTAIPLEVRKNTVFQGVKNAKEVKEGQQVRASFELRNNKNELSSVEVISGAGGAGQSKDNK